MAGLPMRSTDFRSVVEPILNEVFDGLYNQRADEWKGFMQQRTGTARSYHEEPVLHGFGAAPELPDGMPIDYQSAGQLFVARCVYKVFGLAFAMTKILQEDGDHVALGRIFSEYLAQAMIETKETNAANMLNRAFNASYVGGDGVSLVNTAHPYNGGTWSNQLTTAANFSQTPLEQMLIQIRNAVGNNGKKIRLNPVKIVTSPSNQFQVEVVLKSVLRSGTANNDLNPIKSMGLLRAEPAIVSRLTSQTAWFVQTDAQRGLAIMMRRALQRAMEGDFETDSVKYKATERYGMFWVDPRHTWGTPGL